MLRAITVLVILLAQAPQAENTGVIRGRVVEKESGHPLPRAAVALRPPSGGAQQAITDERGEFEFTRLSPGPHTLLASAGEYRASHVTMPYVRPGDSQGSPVFLMKAGEVRDGVEVALPRALAISGRVVDDAGNPAANVVVNMRIVKSVAGFVAGQPPVTDDRGAFRVFGVPAGRYVLCADPQLGPAFGRVLTRRPQHVRTCTGEISVTQEDVSGVMVTLGKVETYTLRGRLIGEDGNVPAPSGITLMQTDESRIRSTSSQQERSVDGSFVISEVPPGTYELSAYGGFRPWIKPEDASQRQWGGMTIEVSTADVDGVVLQLARGASLRGRVVYADSRPADPVRALEVRAEPVGFRSGMRPTALPATVGDDDVFELSGLFGPLTLRVNAPRGYVVKSITYRGRDIHQVPTVFGGDRANEAVVVLTNRLGELSGRVLDPSGAPAPSAWVLYFPADPARWSAFGSGIRQHVTNGRYRMWQLPAGEYFVAAVDSDMSRYSASDYDRLSKVAERVILGEAERRTIDLTVRSIPRVPDAP